MDPTQRFSNRVENYVKYRPTYPKELLPWMAQKCGFQSAWRVADIGSGTGILSKMLLMNGNPVYGVEPNKEMREAAERLIGITPYFRSVNGTAEATTLADQSVELVCAAQAYHWFEPIRTRLEFRRILRQSGYALLVWNCRNSDASPFMHRYEQTLLELIPQYRSQKNADQGSDSGARGLFSSDPMIQTFSHSVSHNWQSLSGLALSASYVPLMGHKGHHALMEGLKNLYDKHQKGDSVQMVYQTRAYLGKIH